MPPQECKPQAAISEPASLSLVGLRRRHDVWELSPRSRWRAHRRWRKHFSFGSSFAGASAERLSGRGSNRDRRRAGVWTPLQLPLSISLPFFFLPRRGVSFRVSEPCYFGERWMGSNCVFRMITMAAATAIAPPRQICGCSDSISRRSDIK